MIEIANQNSQRFTLNGIHYFKNFLSHVNNGYVRVINAYDSDFVLLPWTSVDQVRVDGVVHNNINSLQSALLPILYSRATLGQGDTLDNGIIQIGDIELLEEPKRVKIPVDEIIPIWRIGGVEYTKETDTILNIQDASEGKYRVDLIVANTANDFEVIQGQETEQLGVAPSVPFYSVAVTTVNILGDEIVGNTPPINSNAFIKKTSKQLREWRLYNQDVEVIYLPIDPDYLGFNIINLGGQSGLVGGLKNEEGANQKAILYDGAEFYLRNNGFDRFTLIHDGDAHIPFWFGDEQNYKVNVGEIIKLKYNHNLKKLEPINHKVGYDYFKYGGNLKHHIEPGDFFQGIVQDTFIQGIYNGGGLDNKDNFTTGTEIPLN